ncbi:lysophospholipid acyltransferase family protein [Dyadobacter jiangsuensis]|uniref:KDO2-lipid IV(A) lauroyltransferase n=1 Tax=Dyadobacter jiangsuensis TaxID=1591085 RepID=A0A2P8FQ31_9BACT|nr:lysophospholipid acyltransferase family protein [Dyadobacter jiangsuensis]PSL23836.1 KDO2-lipid IV(A) lauroyltransferase [Dyadobacter jiangsuensis]
MKKESESHNFYVRLLLTIASGLSFLIYVFVYRIFRYRYEVVIGNLSKSFPDSSREQIEHYAQEYYRHMGDLVVESLLFVLVNDATRRKFANYTNAGLLERFYQGGRNIVTLASHCGNWEYMIDIPRVLNVKSYTAYTPLSNQWIDSYILKLRSSFGVTLFAKKYFFRNALSVLKNRNEPCIVVVIADQRPAGGSAKQTVQFLDQSTRVQTGAERLALASGAAVLFLECIKKSRFHYDYTFHVVTEDAEHCQAMEITEAYYRILEENILKSPAHWLWSHKRWKPLPEPEAEPSFSC